VHVPAETIVTVRVDTVHTDVGEGVSVTSRDEDADTVAEKLASPYVLSAMRAKVMVWVAVDTVNETLFVASRYRSSPDWVATSVH
jgi:hypothetical protein